jgi:hypothetical protein
MNNAQLHLLHGVLCVSSQVPELEKLAQLLTASHMPQLLAPWILTKSWHLPLRRVLQVKCAHDCAHSVFHPLLPAQFTQLP